MRKDEALGRLQKILDVDGLRQISSSSSPQFERWWRSAELAIEKVFGSDSRHIKHFKNARDARVNTRLMLAFSNLGPVGPHEVKKDYIRDLESYATIIQSMIDEVGEYWEDGKEVLPSSSSSSSSCGDEQMMTDDLKKKKVFLSHKGDDKELVNDFKETLKVLGYDPWLDKDAMTLGTLLEQGLSQGMKDSCGVVFFITPSFKDEGFLETEITYAIQEKRQKREKFVIITLQFVGVDGNTSEIPELLKPYLWGRPKTLLEALREIVRALPVASTGIDWRAEIESVATESETRLTVVKLSKEAEILLKTAVDTGQGEIMYLRPYGGDEGFHVGGKEFPPPGQETSEAMANWMGGLKDLKQQGYIEGEIQNGNRGLFTVTREGYEAAKHLNNYQIEDS